MSELNLEEVGQAEQALRRLVSERKALEAGYDIVRVFREVKTALQPAADELRSLREQVNAVNNELNNLISEKQRRLREVEESVVLHRTQRLNAIQVDIDKARSELAALQHDCASAAEALDTLLTEHSAKIQQHEVELAQVQQELLEARRQHAAVAEAVSRAANAFRSS